MSLKRSTFREKVYNRDNNTCQVPWCESSADDAHHILERSLWNNGGYIPNNGISLCNKHHKHAENSNIPPQAFWDWLDITDPPLPNWSEETVQTMFETWSWYEKIEDIQNKFNVNKWGEPFERPYNEELRDYIKYQSTRHLLPLYYYDNTSVNSRIENDDTKSDSITEFLDKPLVITHKMDGGNCMMVSDLETPVRARNGTSPEKGMRPLYRDKGLYWTQNIPEKIPDHLQILGEWIYAKHSIHYGCDCTPKCDDVGPPLGDLVDVSDDRAYFQVFGVYNTRYNLWLSWPDTQRIADKIGFPTVPVIYIEDSDDNATFTTKHEARETLIEYAHNVVDNGGEGIIVRTKFPFHYGQFTKSLGKYVRENHVKDEETHWSHREIIENNITE